MELALLGEMIHGIAEYKIKPDVTLSIEHVQKGVE
jgi:hypothetical protein